MRIEWLGHACFLITSAGGARVITDPYDESVGYDPPAVEADVVTTSHDHFDHANTKAVRGKPKRIAAAGRHEVAGVSIHGYPTFHDDEEGAKRGTNIVFTMKVDGVSVCHLGDLGHVLSPAAAGALGHIDVLLIPVGGTYTIDARRATETIALLRPKIAIPLHVKNDKCRFPIDTVDPFLEMNKDKTIVRHEESAMAVTVDTLPSQLEIHVLRHAM
jgi:L-ascorbate metabolism protein UlaG (beta-lactamase superfamily)